MFYFFHHGKGFGVYDTINNCIPNTAFNSCIGGGLIGIRIETQPDYRQKGFASLATVKIIEYVLQQELTPGWGCYSTNLDSATTAKSVGFDPSTTYSISAH